MHKKTDGAGIGYYNDQGDITGAVVNYEWPKHNGNTYSYYRSANEKVASAIGAGC